MRLERDARLLANPNPNPNLNPNPNPSPNPDPNLRMLAGLRQCKALSDATRAALLEPPREAPP